jgi:hypothetical protein
MAHFAKLDDTNTVIEVIVVNNEELLENGVEYEAKGISFCQSLFGGNWVQTSYNASFRKHYAGIDYVYDPIRDAFISPKPYASWILDEDTCDWIAPKPYPNDGNDYIWNDYFEEWQPKEGMPEEGQWRWNPTTQTWEEYNFD